MVDLLINLGHLHLKIILFSKNFWQSPREISNKKGFFSLFLVILKELQLSHPLGSS